MTCYENALAKAAIAPIRPLIAKSGPFDDWATRRIICSVTHKTAFAKYNVMITRVDRVNRIFIALAVENTTPMKNSNRGLATSGGRGILHSEPPDRSLGLFALVLISLLLASYGLYSLL